MAAPTDPTLRDIITEGLKKAGIRTPSPSELDRAETAWMSEIKNDIWIKEKKLKSLYTSSVIILTKGLSRYSMPSNYASDLSLVLMQGTETGTAQTGSASSITLASDEGIAEADAVGAEIVITSETAKGSFSQIVTYSTTTKVATVIPDFETVPDSTSVYMVVNEYDPLTKKAVRRLDQETSPTNIGDPRDYYVTKDDDYGEIIFRDVPDTGPYAVRARYYVNLLTLDTESTLMGLLYRNWRSLFTQGIYFKALGYIRDTDAKREELRYEAKLIDLVLDEIKDLGEDSVEISPGRRN